MPEHLVVVDMQEVFGDPASAWFTPRFGEIVPRIAALVAQHAPRVTFTRFVAPADPAGAWRDYYAEFPFARAAPDAALYRIVPPLAGLARSVVAAPAFGKWGTELAARVGDDDLLLTGVATDCCVISTALAAADAGTRVRVVADACAGSSDLAHEQALAVLALYAPLIEIC